MFKPSKPLNDAKRYLPVSFLCVPFKIVERLIHYRGEPIIEPLLVELASFQRGRSAVEQDTRMSQDIEDGFKNKKAAGAVFMHLNAADDTGWHRCYVCKLHQLLPDRQFSRK